MKKFSSSAQIRETWLCVNRFDEALRQEDRDTEMNPIVRKMSKLYEKGSLVQQAESVRLVKIVNWAMKEDRMQIRYEMNVAIIEIGSKMQEFGQRGRQGRVRCVSRSRVPQMRKTNHEAHAMEEDGLGYVPEWKMTLRMRTEAR